GAFELRNGVTAGTERHLDTSNRIAGRIPPTTRDGPGKNFARLIRSIHPRVSDRQTKSWTTADTLRLLVERNRFVEASHLAIKRGQQWLAINKCGVQL